MLEFFEDFTSKMFGKGSNHPARAALMYPTVANSCCLYYTHSKSYSQLQRQQNTKSAKPHARIWINCGVLNLAEIYKYAEMNVTGRVHWQSNLENKKRTGYFLPCTREWKCDNPFFARPASLSSSPTSWISSSLSLDPTLSLQSYDLKTVNQFMSVYNTTRGNEEWSLLFSWSFSRLVSGM